MIGRDNYLSSNAEILIYPRYTILVPLRNESHDIVRNLLSHLQKIVYPSGKLQILIIVDSVDNMTRGVIRNISIPKNCELIIVPEFDIRTKPLACNYAMQFANGEYVTIYNAEDRPDIFQLKKVISKFYSSNHNIACIQAKLNYHNRRENLLTRLFSIEYSSIFDIRLPYLVRANLPIPLGGTSNHFRASVLREVGLWDPYNVTEDTSLGIKLYMKNHKIDHINSYTMEEAPCNISSWIKQRSRWIKGYVQTYFAFLRHPIKLFRKLGIHGVISFHYTIFSGSVMCIFIILSLCLVFSSSINLNYNTFKWNILFDYLILFLQSYMIGSNFLLSTLYPIYSLLYIVAFMKAIFEIFSRKLHFWDKTEHGVSSMLKKGV